MYVDATLASSLSATRSRRSSTVGVLYLGTLKTTTILPVHRQRHRLFAESGLYIDSGGALAIASPSAITGAGLYVDDNGSGGRCRQTA